MKSSKPHAQDGLRPKICAMFPGALGDFICFLPALQSLERAASVDLLARSAFAEIVPDGIRVSSLERPEISGLFRGDPKPHDDTRGFLQAYDVVYSWFASGNQDFVARLNRITSARAHIFPFRPARADIHQADYYLSCLNDRADSAAQPRVALRSAAVGWRKEFWDENDLRRRAILTIAPGSGAREKNWPAEFFLTVTQWWRKETGGVVILLIGPIEEERGGVERLRSDCIVASGLSLSQAAALLSGSDVYLGNDSGISHLAAALDVRTVVLFGPSNPRQWAPRGKKVILFRRGIGCSPCQERTMKSCPHRACLTELLPEEIISTLAQLPEVVTLTR
jgi:ADP-heptose:LPS heptosyltransferase